MGVRALVNRGFFCEACGAAVKPGSSKCPSCGRTFLAVRCPRCGKEANGDVFSNGCPDCGYLEESPDDIFKPLRQTNRKRPDHPPVFYWVLSSLILLAVFLGLFFWIRTPL